MISTEINVLFDLGSRKDAFQQIMIPEGQHIGLDI